MQKELIWNLFRNTGRIDIYLIYKEISKNNNNIKLNCDDHKKYSEMKNISLR